MVPTSQTHMGVCVTDSHGCVPEVVTDSHGCVRHRLTWVCVSQTHMGVCLKWSQTHMGVCLKSVNSAGHSLARLCCSDNYIIQPPTDIIIFIFNYT